MNTSDFIPFINVSVQVYLLLQLRPPILCITGQELSPAFYRDVSREARPLSDKHQPVSLWLGESDERLLRTTHGTSTHGFQVCDGADQSLRPFKQASRPAYNTWAPRYLPDIHTVIL